MDKKYCTAIVLAAGSGKRMGTKTHKQYLLIGGKPVLYYSLRTFQDSELIDEIILVTGDGEEEYCRETIVEKYDMTKVSRIIPGGKERYGCVFIHDGARPFVDDEMIRRAYACVCEHRACVAGMPAKDTIKVVDKDGVVVDTPDRSRLWIVQTPQVFERGLVFQAYEMLIGKGITAVTDDAMVVEKMLGFPVRMFEGSYENIKITTPEDLETAEAFLRK